MVESLYEAAGRLDGEHLEMDRRAVDCFDAALTDAGFTAEPLCSVLHEYFAWATMTAMATYPASADDVPPDLTIPRWSWQGLVPVDRPTD